MKHKRLSTPNYRIRLWALLAAFVVVFFGSFALGRYPINLFDLLQIL